METCTICQTEFDPTLGIFFDNKWFCRECSIQYGQFETCSRCRRRVARWEYTTHEGKTICLGCYDKTLIEERLARTCTLCGKEIAGPSVVNPEGKKVCLECYRKTNLKPFGARAKCRSCNREVQESEIVYVKNEPICQECLDDFLKKRTFLVCSSCGSKIYEKPFKVKDKVVCALCYSKMKKGEESCAVCGKVIKAIKFIRRDGAILCLDCSRKSQSP